MNFRIVALTTAFVATSSFLAMFSVVRIDGDSMAPTMCDGEVWIATRWMGDRQLMDRNNTVVVLLKDPEQGKKMAKRIVGRPDDTVRLERGLLVKNGHDPAESYVCAPRGLWFMGNWPIGASTPSLVLREGEYFVLGDNRADSTDSRHFGPIHRDAIHGRVLMRISGSQRESVCRC